MPRLILGMLKEFGPPALVKAAASLLAIGFHLVVSRLLGAQQAGVLFTCMTVALFLALLCKWGIDDAALRFVAAEDASKRNSRLGETFSSSLILVTIASTSGYLLFWFLAPSISEALFQPSRETAQIMRVVAISGPALAVIYLHTGLLKGVGLPSAGLFFRSGALPLVASAAFLVVGVSSINRAATIYAVSSSVVVVAAVSSWLTLSPRAPILRPSLREVKKLLRVGTPLVFASALFFAFDMTDILIVSYFRPESEVAVYKVCLKFAASLTFFLVVSTSVTAPRFAAAHESGSGALLQAAVNKTCNLSALLSLPLLVMVVVLRGEILSLFGEGFARGGEVLVILAIAQYIAASIGAARYVLKMCGQEHIVQRAAIYGVTANVAFNMMVVPYFGMHGAAWATGISIVGVNIYMAIKTYHIFDVRPIPLLDI